MGTAVLFKAWLPHLTRASAEGRPPAPAPRRRIGACTITQTHTAYWRFGTEYFKQTLSKSLSPRVLCVGGWRGGRSEEMPGQGE